MATTDTQPWAEATAALEANPPTMPAPQRRALAASAAEAILCGEADGSEEALVGLLELLCRDPDWSVRLEVARMAHMLEDELAARLIAALRADCNRYVRVSAERSLARRRKSSRSDRKDRNEIRSYSRQVDELGRRFGPGAAREVVALGNRRFALLATGVAHDMQSILTTLSANVAAMAKGKDAGRVQSITEDIGYLQRTVEGLEQLSRPLPVARRPEDVGEMIGEAVRKARDQVDLLGHDHGAVRIEVAFPPSVRLRVCRRLIVLALTNVIKNAMEAFADGGDALRPGRIDVTAVVDGYETRISVRDDALGLEPEVLCELQTFAPGARNRAKRVSSGWGLCLTHRYITAHGGQVGIDSAFDQGTTVTLTLPMRNHDEGVDA